MSKKHIFKGTGLTKKETEWGQNRLDDYLQSFPHLKHSLGNLLSLEEIVWLETIQERFKKNVGTLPQGGNLAENTAIPSGLQKSIQDGQNMIIVLKEKLKMFDERRVKEEELKTEDITDRFKSYRETHLDVVLLRCCWCAAHYLLVRKIEKYDAEVKRYFEDKFLNNRPLFKIYKEGRITKEQVSEILGVTPEYVSFLEKKVYGLGTLPNREQDPKN